jgi:hypothetical protein
MTPESIAAFLRKYGFTVQSWTDGDEQIDGEVKVTDTISVQVGQFHDYAIVSRVDLDRGLITHCPERGPRQKALILADIRKLLDS